MEKHKTEMDLTKQVLEFLLSRGFPSHAIALGSSFQTPRGSVAEVDIAITGRPLHNYLGFIEVSSTHSEDKRRTVARRFRELMIFTRVSVPCFLFERAEPENSGLRIYRLDGLDWIAISLSAFPPYEAFIANAGAQRRVEQTRRRNVSLDTLTKHCRALFAFIITILGLDLCGLITLRIEHIYFILILAGLVVIPEISEITTSGFSLKRSTKDKE